MAPIIGIDPGHGGYDPGAVGINLKLKEKNINLQIAKKLQEKLENAGFRTFMTRTDDSFISLQERANLLDNKNVEIVISVHINSSESREANYISSHIIARGGEAEKLAETVQAKLVSTTGWSDGGVRTNNFYIIRETKAPAVLVELGFISNDVQEKELNTSQMQEKLATALSIGINNYFHSTDNNDNNSSSKITDISGHWAELDIIQIVNKDIMSVGSNGKFYPNQTVTKAQLAAVANRLLNYKKK